MRPHDMQMQILILLQVRRCVHEMRVCS